MRFFDRENEIAELRRIREVSHETARFTVLTGRRRVGIGLNRILEGMRGDF